LSKKHSAKRWPLRSRIAALEERASGPRGALRPEPAPLEAKNRKI